CALRDTRLGGAGLPCRSNTQCPSDSVCFLGECRGSSSQLALVEAEVRAPASEQLGTVQRNGIDLRVSPVVDFHLLPLLSASGSVTRRLDDGGVESVVDAGVVLTVSSPPIPDAQGPFSMQLPPPPLQYFLHVGPAPAAPAASTPVPAFPARGPFSGPSPGFTCSAAAGNCIDLGALPDSATLTGTVLDVRRQPLASVAVLAVSTDANGWVISRHAVTDSTGTFTLALRTGLYSV